MKNLFKATVGAVVIAMAVPAFAANKDLAKDISKEKTAAEVKAAAEALKSAGSTNKAKAEVVAKSELVERSKLPLELIAKATDGGITTGSIGSLVKGLKSGDAARVALAKQVIEAASKVSNNDEAGKNVIEALAQGSAAEGNIFEKASGLQISQAGVLAGKIVAHNGNTERAVAEFLTEKNGRTDSPVKESDKEVKEFLDRVGSCK